MLKTLSKVSKNFVNCGEPYWNIGQVWKHEWTLEFNLILCFSEKVSDDCSFNLIIFSQEVYVNRYSFNFWTPEICKHSVLSKTPDWQQIHFNTLSPNYFYLENVLFIQPDDFPNKKIKCFGDVEGVLVFWGLGWGWYCKRYMFLSSLM